MAFRNIQMNRARNKIGDLRSNPDWAKYDVGEGIVNGIKKKFYPNGFGMGAWIYGHNYAKLDYQDGSASHCYPRNSRPGLCSHAEFRRMLEKDFKTATTPTEFGDIITINYITEDYTGPITEEGERAKRENLDSAFSRTRTVDIFIFLNDAKNSHRVLGINPHTMRFEDTNLSKTAQKPYCYFFHSLK